MAEQPFSNHTEFEIWADGGRGCYDCVNDDPDVDKYCPILMASLSGWPREWLRATRRWELGGESGSYEVVDECTEFEERTDWPGEDPDDIPEPDPVPPPVVEGQVDMFEVFAEQVVEHIESAVAAR